MVVDFMKIKISNIKVNTNIKNKQVGSTNTQCY